MSSGSLVPMTEGSGWPHSERFWKKVKLGGEDECRLWPGTEKMLISFGRSLQLPEHLAATPDSPPVADTLNIGGPRYAYPDARARPWQRTYAYYGSILPDLWAAAAG